MIEASVQVGGRSGLDGRRSARLAVGAAQFASDILCMANGRTVNGKDVMSLMSLRVRAGASLRIAADGPDERAALDSLSAIVAAHDAR